MSAITRGRKENRGPAQRDTGANSGNDRFAQCHRQYGSSPCRQKKNAQTTVVWAFFAAGWISHPVYAILRLDKKRRASPVGKRGEPGTQMFYLLLTIVSSTLISIVMRFSEGRIAGRISMLAVNYLTCMVLAACHTQSGALFPQSEGLGSTLVLGAVNGALLMLSLVLNQESITKNGVVLSTVFSRIGSLLVPIAISLCFFGEVPTLVQAVGAGLAVVAIVAINAGGKQEAASARQLLFLLLLADGLASALSKVFDEVGDGALSGHFLIYSFAAAFLASGVLAVAKKEKIGRHEVAFGMMVGIPNFYAARFLLMALEELPAIIVYPMRGVLGIVAIALAGVFLFRERLQKRQWSAIGLILLSVALLNL